MFDFLKIQYEMGNLTEDELENFVPRWITEEQKQEIING